MATLQAFDVVLMGRKTYELSLRLGHSTDPVKKNYVFSHTLKESPDKFVDYLKAGNDLPYGKMDDFHWDVAGNQLAAQVMAEWLIAQGFVVTE